MTNELRFPIKIYCNYKEKWKCF